MQLHRREDAERLFESPGFLKKHHGVSGKFFPLCLKELELRYNLGQLDLFEKPCPYHRDFVPDVGESPGIIGGI